MLKYLAKIPGKNARKGTEMTMSRTFQQFFTPKKYSQVMINALEIQPPKKIIDLAMGEGSLLLEAMQRWEGSSYYGNDIDPDCCQLISNKHSSLHCHHYDIFLNSSISTLVSDIGKVDLCIGNPPFHLIPQDSNIRKILKEFKLDKTYKSDFIPSEVPFILQNFKILRENGTLALILPDGFFTNEYLKSFRQFLIENYHIDKVIELPKNIFKKTQAKTHILILKNTKPSLSTILLSQIEGDSIRISFPDAIKRMDYSYYKHQQSLQNTEYLHTLNVTFLRGKSKYLINDIDEKHILHTTSFKKNNIFKNNLRTINKLKKYQNQIAIPGDIIVSRVGSNCIGRVGLVQNGYFIATDCIFIIRTEDPKLRELIYNELTSYEGQEWIQSHAKGVAARHITLEEIKKFPISLKKNNVRLT